MKETKENYQKGIEIYDEGLRKEMNVKPEMKMVTLDMIFSLKTLKGIKLLSKVYPINLIRCTGTMPN